MLYISLSRLTVLASTSNIILTKTGNGRNPGLVPDLEKLSVFTVECDVCYWVCHVMVFITLRLCYLCVLCLVAQSCLSL